MRLFTLSMCSLVGTGQRWIRLGSDGPGVRIIDTRSRNNPFRFSMRHGLMRGVIRIGPYAIVWMPAGRACVGDPRTG